MFKLQRSMRRDLSQRSGFARTSTHNHQTVFFAHHFHIFQSGRPSPCSLPPVSRLS